MTGTPITLTTEETEKLLRELLGKKNTRQQILKGCRNYCMALLMLDAGLRVGEVVALEMSDLLISSNVVHSLRIRPAIAKNKLERIVPMSGRLRKSIEVYFKEWFWLTESSQQSYAFCTSFPNRHLTTRQVERIIRKAATKSLGRPVHPHVLRHTFASRLMRTTNARIVQELLGHSHLSTTQIYTHPNQDDLKNAIQSLDRTQLSNDVTEPRSTSIAEIANGTDTMHTDRDMR